MLSVEEDENAKIGEMLCELDFQKSLSCYERI